MGLIHHAAATNNVDLLQLILSFKSVNVNLTTSEGKKAIEITTNSQVR